MAEGFQNSAVCEPTSYWEARRLHALAMGVSDRIWEPVSKDNQVECVGVPIFDGCWQVAVDTSASTALMLDRSARLTALAATQSLLASIWSGDVEVIAWNEIAAPMPLHSVRSDGGTRPCALFPRLLPNCKTLLITTGGGIGASWIPALESLVLQSSLVNVVAVFLHQSHRGRTPFYLNLPLFFSFMDNVVGRVVICGYDGHTLRVLLKRCKGDPTLPETALPDPPQEILRESTWEDFPAVEPRDLLKVSLPTYVEALSRQVRSSFQDNDPRVLCNSRWWNLEKLKTELEVLEADVATELLQELIGAAKTPTQRGLLREGLQIWYRCALEASRRKVLGLREQNKQVEPLKCKGDYLYEKIRRHVLKRRVHQQELAAITMAVFHPDDAHRRAVQQGTSSAEAQYNALARRLSGKGTDCSLGALVASLKSNRALQAVDAWHLDGACHTQCHICAEVRPQALLAMAIPPEQTLYNTSHFALDDAFSLGSANAKFLPASNVCVFCANFLLSRNRECPYTGQRIATILPVVRHTGSNFKRLAYNVSYWLFGGKKVRVEWQALLAVLDAVRSRGGGSGGGDDEGPLEFLEQEYVPHITANFQGTFAEGRESLLEAISRLFASFCGDPAGLKLRGCRSAGPRCFPPCPSCVTCIQGNLVSLRNRTLESMAALGRLGIKYGKASADDVSNVMNRMLFKTIVSRALGWLKEKGSTKHEKLERLRRVLESDLYDTRGGFPVKGTGKVIASLAESRSLVTLFGRTALRNFMLQPLTSFPGHEVQPSHEMVTVVLYKLLVDVDYRKDRSPEDLVRDLVARHPLVALAFNSPGALSPEDALGLTAELNKDLQGIAEELHRLTIPCFSPAHMLAPSVACCGACGQAFIHSAEMQVYFRGSHSGKQQQELIARTVMERRSQHFKQVFGSGLKSGMVDKTSGHSNIHRGVAWVMLQFVSGSSEALPGLPTRSMVLQVLAYFHRFPKGGELYDPTLLQTVAAVLFDYLEKMNSLLSQGTRLANPGNFSLPFSQRLSAEVEYLERKQLLGHPDQVFDWMKVFPPVSKLQNRDPVLVAELTKPVSVDELLSVYMSKRRRRPHNLALQKQPSGTTDRKYEINSGIATNMNPIIRWVSLACCN